MYPTIISIQWFCGSGCGIFQQHSNSSGIVVEDHTSAGGYVKTRSRSLKCKCVLFHEMGCAEETICTQNGRSVSRISDLAGVGFIFPDTGIYHEIFRVTGVTRLNVDPGSSNHLSTQCLIVQTVFWKCLSCVNTGAFVRMWLIFLAH